MIYNVLSSYDDHAFSCSQYTEYDKALMKFFTQFATNIANHNTACAMIVDNFGNVLKMEHYAREIIGQPENTEE